MSVERETTVLRSLARRLSEPWPAEERLFRWRSPTDQYEDEMIVDVKRRMFPHQAAGVDGYWQHRRASAEEEWRGAEWRPSRALPTQPRSTTLSAEGQATWDRLRNDYGTRGGAQGRAQALEGIGGERRPRSWMPSIAGVGPVRLWFAAGEEPVEEWRTYEAIRAGIKLGESRRDVVWDWSLTLPPEELIEASRIASKVLDVAFPSTEQDLDVFARAVADRLRPPPRPKQVKHLGALPRDWKAARRRQKERRAASVTVTVTTTSAGVSREGFGVPIVLGSASPVRRLAPEESSELARSSPGYRAALAAVAPPENVVIGAAAPPGSRSTRSTLGTLAALAARYTPRRPDGSYNRHDARRWMRAFRREALVASDALEQGGDRGRLDAIAALCRVVGVDDAVRLVERPVSAGERLAREMAEYRSPPDDRAGCG